jgi:hypothetical protein
MGRSSTFRQGLYKPQLKDWVEENVDVLPVRSRLLQVSYLVFTTPPVGAQPGHVKLSSVS